MKAILTDARLTLSLSVSLEGEYGLSGINRGMPRVTRRGASKVLWKSH